MMFKKVLLASVILGFGAASAHAMKSQECQSKFIEAHKKIASMNKLSDTKRVALTRASIRMHDTCQAIGDSNKVAEFFDMLKKSGG